MDGEGGGRGGKGGKGRKGGACVVVWKGDSVRRCMRGGGGGDGWGQWQILEVGFTLMHLCLWR